MDNERIAAWVPCRSGPFTSTLGVTRGTANRIRSAPPVE